MKKNYYEILQIDKNASPEIIEKAYKTLAKKYHPDLQTSENKGQAEEILKQINEAYEVLSDIQKKKNYDEYFANNSISEEEFDEIYKENQDLKNKLNHMHQTNYDAYIQDLKNRGYKIRYKKSFKDYFKSFLALFLTILILFILFQIPFVKNFLASIYQDNPILHSLVDGIINLFHIS